MHGFDIAIERNPDTNGNESSNGEWEIKGFGCLRILYGKILLGDTESEVEIDNQRIRADSYTISLVHKQTSIANIAQGCDQVALGTICNTNITLSSIGYFIIRTYCYTIVCLLIVARRTG